MSIRFEGTLEEVVQQAVKHLDERLIRAQARDQTLFMTVMALVASLKAKGSLDDRFIASLTLIEKTMLASTEDDDTRGDVEMIIGNLLHVMGADRPKPKRTSFTVIDGGKE